MAFFPPLNLGLQKLGLILSNLGLSLLSWDMSHVTSFNRTKGSAPCPPPTPANLARDVTGVKSLARLECQPCHFLGCVTLIKWLNLSEPCFPCLDHRWFL